MSLHSPSTDEDPGVIERSGFKIYTPEPDAAPGKLFDGLRAPMEDTPDLKIAMPVRRIRLRTMEDFQKLQRMLRTEKGRADITAMGSIRFVTDNDEVKRALLTLEGKKAVPLPAEETTEETRVRVRTVLNNKQWRELDRGEQKINRKTVNEREEHLASELRFVESQISAKEEGRVPVTMDVPSEKMLIDIATFFLKYPERLDFDEKALKHVHDFRAPEDPKDKALLDALRAARTKAAGPGPLAINVSGANITSGAVARELLLLAIEGAGKIQWNAKEKEKAAKPAASKPAPKTSPAPQKQKKSPLITPSVVPYALSNLPKEEPMKKSSSSSRSS